MDTIEEEIEQLIHLLRVVAEGALSIAFATAYVSDFAAISKEADKLRTRLVEVRSKFRASIQRG